MSNLLKVGVTGGIGSGKSLICSIFSHLGIPVYDSDQRAKRLMIADEKIVKEIKKIFGAESYDPAGQLNRNHIAGLVFNNKENLAKLNGIVHPRVAVHFKEWCDAQLHNSYVIKEAALMFESGANKALDVVINVSAPLDLRISRILQRDPFRSEKEIMAIIDKQMPEEERLEKSDKVIYNDQSNMVIPQVLALHEAFLKN